MLGRGLARLARPNPELQWLAVSGQILEARVEDDPDSASVARIRYAYRYQQACHEGRRIAPVEIWLGDSTAKKFVNKYPPNASVTVYLNPKKPTEAVLEPQQQPMAAFGSILFGVTFVISGSMVWFFQLMPKMPLLNSW